MNKKYILILVSIISFYAASQEVQPSKSGSSMSFLTSIFSPKIAELTKLIDAKKIYEANDYLAKEYNYFFVEKKKEQIELLRRVGSELNAVYEPEFDKSINAINQSVILMPKEKWQAYKIALADSGKLIEDYKKLTIFSVEEFRTSKLISLENLINTKNLDFRSNAYKAFSEFDHSAENNFFTLYPVDLNDDFLDKNTELLKYYVQSLGAEKIVNLKKKYSEKIKNENSFDQLLYDRYIKIKFPDTTERPQVDQLINSLKEAEKSGFKVKKMPGSQIAFVEVTSKTLLSEGQIEFPTQIEMDMPFEPIKADIDSIMDTAGKINSDFIIILDVAVSKTERRVLSKNELTSKFVSGRRSEPNPAYDLARGKVFEAQNGLANAQSQRTQGIAAAIINGVAIAAWSSNLTEARQLMAKTPTTLQIDEFQDYKYSTSEIIGNRLLTANYYVIDKRANRYYKGIFDIAEKNSFRIAYNLNDKDPERSKILSQYSKESDLASYEKAPIKLPVSLLIEDYLKNASKSKQLQDITALRDEMLVDKNKALTEYKKSQFTAKAINDPRFDSVVVVNNPKGPLGTGFFVAPDLVLTNYHVIEGAQFIEMKLFNGLETFGKVVKTDIRLDLALVKVQTRGIPVSFFQENTLELGATVEAIGHPKGLTFTITRGVVSAVREKPSIYGVGGKDVLFVQTDAAINPGNSGGPLFLGDKFIGVNNNKLVAGSEGLGFSIHYSEVSRFLKESF